MGIVVIIGGGAKGSSSEGEGIFARSGLASV